MKNLQFNFYQCGAGQGGLGLKSLNSSLPRPPFGIGLKSHLISTPPPLGQSRKGQGKVAILKPNLTPKKLKPISYFKFLTQAPQLQTFNTSTLFIKPVWIDEEVKGSKVELVENMLILD